MIRHALAYAYVRILSSGSLTARERDRRAVVPSSIIIPSKNIDGRLGQTAVDVARPPVASSSALRLRAFDELLPLHLLVLSSRLGLLAPPPTNSMYCSSLAAFDMLRLTLNALPR